MGERPSLDRLDELLKGLHPDVVDVLFGPDPAHPDRQIAYELNIGRTSMLYLLGTFDAFVACVLLMAKCEALGQNAARELARNAFIDLQDAMDADQVIGPFCSEICDFTDAAFQDRLFRNNQHMVEFHQLTHNKSIRRAMERMGAVRVPGPDVPDEEVEA